MSSELELRSPAVPGLGAAAALSIGAGVIHAAMVGVHAEHPTLARLFIAAAVFQIGWGLVALDAPEPSPRARRGARQRGCVRALADHAPHRRVDHRRAGVE
ncbi:MAG: hypothetical protein WKF58_03345 [Ilumatobacteraceae bacterium]